MRKVNNAVIQNLLPNNSENNNSRSSSKSTPKFFFNDIISAELKNDRAFNNLKKNIDSQDMAAYVTKDDKSSGENNQIITTTQLKSLLNKIEKLLKSTKKNTRPKLQNKTKSKLQNVEKLLKELQTDKLPDEIQKELENFNTAQQKIVKAIVSKKLKNIFDLQFNNVADTADSEKINLKKNTAGLNSEENHVVDVSQKDKIILGKAENINNNYIGEKKSNNVIDEDNISYQDKIPLNFSSEDNLDKIKLQLEENITAVIKEKADKSSNITDIEQLMAEVKEIVEEVIESKGNKVVIDKKELEKSLSKLLKQQLHQSDKPGKDLKNKEEMIGQFIMVLNKEIQNIFKGYGEKANISVENQKADNKQLKQLPDNRETDFIENNLKTKINKNTKLNLDPHKNLKNMQFRSNKDQPKQTTEITNKIVDLISKDPQIAEKQLEQMSVKDLTTAKKLLVNTIAKINQDSKINKSSSKNNKDNSFKITDKLADLLLNKPENKEQQKRDKNFLDIFTKNKEINPKAENKKNLLQFMLANKRLDTDNKKEKRLLPSQKNEINKTGNLENINYKNSGLKNSTISSKMIQTEDSLVDNNQNGVMDQVKAQIESFSKTGENEVEMQLEPEFLGKVKMNLKVDDGVVSLNIEVENQVVKGKLEQNLHLLKSNFLRQGFNVDHVQVETDNYEQAFKHQSDSQHHQQQAQYYQDQHDNSQYEGLSLEELMQLLAEEEKGMENIPVRWMMNRYHYRHMDIMA